MSANRSPPPQQEPPGGEEKGPKSPERGNEEDPDELSGSSPRVCEHLAPFDVRGWTPDASLTDSENYMDAVMLLTRNSKCRQGSMGCIIVGNTRKGGDDDGKGNDRGASGGGGTGAPEAEAEAEAEQTTRPILDSILGASINLPLFSSPREDGVGGGHGHGGDSSDIHAEIAALGQAARRGNATENSTAYITMPPCKRCFAALVSAGVTRIVTRRPCVAKAIADAAEGRGVEMRSMDQESIERQTTRIERLMTSADADDGSAKTEEVRDRTAEERKKRKEERKARKKRRVETAQEMAEVHRPKK